jgi:hypothetical protein
MRHSLIGLVQCAAWTEAREAGDLAAMGWSK